MQIRISNLEGRHWNLDKPDEGRGRGRRTFWEGDIPKWEDRTRTREMVEGLNKQWETGGMGEIRHYVKPSSRGHQLRGK